MLKQNLIMTAGASAIMDATPDWLAGSASRRHLLKAQLQRLQASRHETAVSLKGVLKSGTVGRLPGMSVFELCKLAISSGSAEELQQLLSWDCNLAFSESACKEAVIAGSLDVLKLLRGVDPFYVTLHPAGLPP